MGISFKDENKDAPVYLKKHLVVETMQNHSDKYDSLHVELAQKTAPNTLILYQNDIQIEQNIPKNIIKM